jgi:hypothetical protein
VVFGVSRASRVARSKHLQFVLGSFVVVALGLARFVGLAQALPFSSAARPPEKSFLVKVNARIRISQSSQQVGNKYSPVKVFFNPSIVNVGTVLIVVTNSDVEGHILEINGKTSRFMHEDGGRAVMRVTFRKPGTYFVGLGIDIAADNVSRFEGGSLTVVK